VTANRPRLLVTGFGPFPGIPRNPSAEIARRVAASPRWRRLGIAARCLILPTTYAVIDEHLDPALKEAPDAVLMIGVAGRAARVRIERRAVNRASLLLPDAAGRRPTALTLSDCASARVGRAAPVMVRAILRRHAIPCGISQDAGRYLCNAAYYRALAAPVPVLFVHIPNPPRAARRRTGAPMRLSWEEQLAAALTDVAVRLLAGRRSPVPARGAGSPLPMPVL
jgi:pyroglutamyl-peptidase